MGIISRKAWNLVEDQKVRDLHQQASHVHENIYVKIQETCFANVKHVIRKKIANHLKRSLTCSVRGMCIVPGELQQTCASRLTSHLARVSLVLGCRHHEDG